MILPRTCTSSLMGSGASLLADWAAVETTLEQLASQLRECRPHPRDYFYETLAMGETKTEFMQARDQHDVLEGQVASMAEYAYRMIKHLSR